MSRRLDVSQTSAIAPKISSPWRRFGQVLRVLARHGFLGALRGRRHWPSPQAAREALEELGIVYVKFGQVLALRRDLLPPAYVEELERLQDRLTAIDAPTVRTIIAMELGQPTEQIFATFDETPLAAASIAQVHAATLHDGRRVAVKVRRPGLMQQIADDIVELTYVAALAERVAPRLRALDLVGMVREFRDSLVRETNLALEGETILRFRASLADDRDVWIPDVVPEHTTSGVLTIAYSSGERIDRYVEQHPNERQGLARRVAALLLRQVIETGLFNADPHPGNLFVLADGRLCLHDFGMTGELDEALRDALTHVLEATVVGDARALTDAYLELGLVGEEADRATLEEDIAVLLRRVRAQPVANVSVGELLDSLLRVAGPRRIREPGPMLLLVRAFLIGEALIRRLDPAVNVVELFSAEARRIMVRRYSAGRVLDESRALGRDVERLLHDAPADVRRVLRRLADGELGRVRAPTVEVVAARASRSLERLTGAIVSAAFVVGGALLMTMAGWHHALGAGLLAVGVLGATATALGALVRPRRE